MIQHSTIEISIVCCGTCSIPILFCFGRTDGVVVATPSDAVMSKSLLHMSQQQQQQLFKQQTIRERVVKYMSVSYLMFHQVIKVCGVWCAV